MAQFLDRIDSAPIANSDFDAQFLQWLWVLVDSLNENFSDLDLAINFLTAPSLTAAQISTQFLAGDFTNGIFLYDTTNDEYVGMQAGVLVKFTTSAYP